MLAGGAAFTGLGRGAGTTAAAIGAGAEVVVVAVAVCEMPRDFWVWRGAPIDVDRTVAGTVGDVAAAAGTGRASALEVTGNAILCCCALAAVAAAVACLPIDAGADVAADPVDTGAGADTGKWVWTGAVTLGGEPRRRLLAASAYIGTGSEADAVRGAATSADALAAKEAEVGAEAGV